MSEFISKGSGHHDRRGNCDGATQDKNNGGNDNGACLDHETYQTALSLTLLSSSIPESEETNNNSNVQQEIVTKKRRKSQSGHPDSEREKRRKQNNNYTSLKHIQKWSSGEQDENEESRFHQDDNEEADGKLTRCGAIVRFLHVARKCDRYHHGPKNPNSISYHHGQEQEQNSKQHDPINYETQLNEQHHQRQQREHVNTQSPKLYSLTTENLKLFDNINDKDESTSSFSNSTASCGVGAVKKEKANQAFSFKEKNAEATAQKSNKNDTTNHSTIISKSRHDITTSESSMKNAVTTTYSPVILNDKKVVYGESKHTREISCNTICANGNDNERITDKEIRQSRCQEKYSKLGEDTSINKMNAFQRKNKSINGRSATSSYVDRSHQPDIDPSQPLTPPNRIANFITKLYIVLTIRSDLQNVIQWLPHGRSFRIVDPVEFELSVIPIYFGLMTLASFYKKIDRFGFQHIVGNTTAKDACNSMGYASYFHEYFLRGRPWLCKSVTKMKLQKSDGDRATRNNRSTKLSAPYKQTHQSGFDEDPIMEEDLIRASRIRSLPAIGPRSTNNPYQSSLLSIDAFIQKHGPKARILAGLCNIRCPLTLADEELSSSESCPAIAIAMTATPAATTTEGSDTSEILNGNAREAFGESNTKPSKEMPKIHNEKHNDADQNFSETNCTASKLQQKGCENIVTWGPVNRTSHQGSQHHHHQEIPLEHNITLLQCLEELQKQIQLHNNAPIAVNTNQNEQHGLHQQVHSHASRQFQTQHDNRVDVHIQAPNRNIANMLQPSTWDVSAVANINNILTTSSNSNIPQQQHQISSQHQTLQGGGGNDPNNNVAQHFGFQRTYAANVEDLARQILASTVVQTNTYTPTATSQQFNIYLPTSLGRNNSVNSFNNIHPAMDAEFQRLLSRAINSGVIQGAASTTMNSKKNN